MAKKRRRRFTRLETMQRNATVSSFTPRMRLSIRGANDPEPEVEGRPWLELRGTLVEPIRDVKNVVFKLWPDPHARVGPARPAAIGYIMGIRPAVEFDTGTGIILPVLPGFIGTIVVERGCVIAVNFVPSDQTARYREYQQRAKQLDEMKA